MKDTNREQFRNSGQTPEPKGARPPVDAEQKDHVVLKKDKDNESISATRPPADA